MAMHKVEHFHTAPRLLDGFEHVPFPGVWNGFVVDIRDELGRVQAPTLVIRGAQARWSPSAARTYCTKR